MGAHRLECRGRPTMDDEGEDTHMAALAGGSVARDDLHRGRDARAGRRGRSAHGIETRARGMGEGEIGVGCARCVGCGVRTWPGGYCAAACSQDVESGRPRLSGWGMADPASGNSLAV